MATSIDSGRLKDAVVAFSLDGRFPEDIASVPSITGTDLQPSIDALQSTKAQLEVQVHTINDETRDDVSSWVKNAKALQEDIIRSKAMANDIVRQSEAPDVSGQTIQDAEKKLKFLEHEVQYSQQLHSVLKRVQHATQLLNQVEQAQRENRIVESLRLLEKSWSTLDNTGIGRSCRVIRLLDIRATELKSTIHDAFNQRWKEMIHVDDEAKTLTVRSQSLDGNMTLSDIVIGLQAYKEVDERMEQLWRSLHAAIVLPRMKFGSSDFQAIQANADSVTPSGAIDGSVEALLADLSTLFSFLSQSLPQDLLRVLTRFMMGDVVPKLVQEWLDSEIPLSLQNIERFQDLVEKARLFCSELEQQGYSDFDELRNWVEKAPMIWLEKCRDTALDRIRSNLMNGIGAAKQVEKVEKHMVSLAEGRELATTGAGAATGTNDWNEDWGDAWNADEQAESVEGSAGNLNADMVGNGEDDGTDAWGWEDDGTGQDEDEDAKASNGKAADATEEDDVGAWAWGDEEATADSPESQEEPPKRRKVGGVQAQRTKELTMRETYNISSMPEPVLDLIAAILEDGAALTTGEDNVSLVAGTAAGLFTVPTFALALFRAISPHYYSLADGGQMFLYNDAMYMAERLTDFAARWKEREDLTARAKSLLRLDNDIKTLRSFANRSYGSEMDTQRTILQDLLGGAQGLLQQDDMESAVESGVGRIRTMAQTWEPILARSVWSQAIGSLVDSLAKHIISDVLEMSAIGQEEAYNIAKVISSATNLDDLFLPSKLAGVEADAANEEIPTTAQYAPNWIRLKYLSEVLQSNLNEVKYLWCDSELSLYFTMEEVIDLIRASFEENARTRETIKEIQARPPLTAEA